MAQSKEQAEELKAASKTASKATMEDFIDLLNSPSRLAWLNFYAGMFRGAGVVIGGAVALVALGLAVTYLGGVPILGKFISNIAAAAGQVPTQ